MAALEDKEFGTITIRRSALSRSVKLSVAPNGRLRVSMPPYAPLFMAKRLVNSSRAEVRQMLAESDAPRYEHGMQVGKSHTLEITHGGERRSTRAHGQRIHIKLPAHEAATSPDAQAYIRQAVTKALRKEASSYLPKRLAYLAHLHGFHYQKVRFSHASSRWGSCSSHGTISLNIALMKLPFEQIDYVLVHELAHTQEMNHSAAFWQLVEDCLPDYREARRAIKRQTPSI